MSLSRSFRVEYVTLKAKKKKITPIPILRDETSEDYHKDPSISSTLKFEKKKFYFEGVWALYSSEER